MRPRHHVVDVERDHVPAGRDASMTRRGNGTTTVGLLADPGLPTKLARQLAGELPALLDDRAGGRWTVQVGDTELGLDARAALPMVEIGTRARDRGDWDVVVLLSDLPRRSGSQPVVADASTGERIGMVSLPALGAFAQYRRVRDTVASLVVEHLAPGSRTRAVTDRRGAARPLTRIDAQHGRSGRDVDAGGDPDTGTGPSPGTGTGTDAGTDTHTGTDAGSGTHTGTDAGSGTHTGTDAGSGTHTDAAGAAGTEDAVDVRLGLAGVRGRVRLLAGLVRANRPWRLVSSLAPALAAAAAGAAFGIFYSNIWMLATALGVGRHVAVALLAVGAMIVWLIANNQLWERRSSRSLREEAILSNASTVLTVGAGVVIMYLVLFVISLVSAVVVIPPAYLGGQLGRGAGFDDYLVIAWLSCSMGTVAGALGSGFADEDAVRQAAYSRRELERRARLDEQDSRS